MSLIRISGGIIAAALLCASTVAMAEGDAAKGKKVFNKCKACHALEAGKKKIGPSLAGIIGRPAAAEDGFKYSKAMKESGIEWSEENIRAFVAKPKKFMKGTKMAFPGLKKEKDIDNLMAFLEENT